LYSSESQLDDASTHVVCVGGADRWTRYERSRLQKLMINYVAPRWVDIRINGKLTKRSEAQVKQYALDFVRQCIRYAGFYLSF